jgi:HSP20 family protein
LLPLGGGVCSQMGGDTTTTAQQRKCIMANEQSKGQADRSTERQGGAIARGGEQRMASRQYQDPFSLFEHLFNRMSRDFFGSSLLGGFGSGSSGEWSGGEPMARVPRVQMRDAGDALEVCAEMPGIDPKNISVRLDQDMLTISGEERAEEGKDDSRTQRYSSFYRELMLPESVDTENPEASYRNGMLTIRFRRKAARASAREIPIRSEHGGEQGQTRAA